MTTFNFAHRGARSLAPENTMPAIEKAWEIGTHGIEVDVQVSSDGHLVLHHDTTLARTTNISEIFPDRVQLPLTTFRLNELQKLDAGSWFIDSDPFGQISGGKISFEEMETFQNSHIPTLEEVLLYIKDKSWRINLELKEVSAPLADFPLAEKTIELIKRLDIKNEQLIISSFDHNNLDIVHALDPAIEINALIGDNDEGINDWGKFEYSVYNANASGITREQIDKAIKHGSSVNLYTVNNPEKMRQYIEWGVRGIITDFPQILATIT